MHNVILDSNILHEEGFFSNDMLMLKSLVDDDLVRIHLPELVCREFNTHKTYKILEALDKSIKTINGIDRDAKKNSTSLTEKMNALKEQISLASNDIEANIEGAFASWIDEYNVHIIPLDSSSTHGVFDDYFKGEGAFRSRKVRDDIPDAFISKSIMSLIETFGEVVVIIKDGEFSKFLKKVPHVTVLEDLRDLFDLAGLEKSLSHEEIRNYISSTEFSHAIEEYLENQPQALGSFYFEAESIDGADILDVFLLNASLELDAFDQIDILDVTKVRFIDDNEFSALIKIKMDAGLAYVTDYVSVLGLEKNKTRDPSVWSMNGEGVCDVTEMVTLEITGDLKINISDYNGQTDRASILNELLTESITISLEVKSVEVISLA